jgi:excisionase family DNA binding protein
LTGRWCDDKPESHANPRETAGGDSVKRDGAIVRAYDMETVSDASIRMGVSPSWVYQLIKNGILDYYEIGNRKLVHRRDIDGLIQKRAS